MQLKLAWRNVWRNKRRTFITMASVFFSVLLSTLMMSIKEGAYSGMINTVVSSYTGFGQIHIKGYWEEKTPDYCFKLTEKFVSEINQTPGVRNSMERVEGIAMVISADITKVAIVTGINVQKEAEINKLDERVFSGEYLHPEDKAVMIGAGLADYLNLQVGDTIVLLGQGYHGAAAAGKYPVKGIVKLASPELSKQLVFLPLKEAQWFYGMEEMTNTLVLHFDDQDKQKKIVDDLRKKLGNEYEVMGWEEMMPELKNMIETDRVEGYVFSSILYVVVSFGIFGTILMMLAERTREFGVLVSIGMKRFKLAVMVWMEVILISIAGALSGTIVAYPLCYYFQINPIKLGGDLERMAEEYGMEAVLAASVESSVFIQQAIVILLISCVISIYPFVKLIRLNAVNAMRN